MADDLKVLIKELKSKVQGRKSLVEPFAIEKVDLKKQKKDFVDFLANYDLEIQKSNDNDEFVQNMIKDFRTMRVSDIRFVVEKSYDKYNKMAVLVKKYEDNFSEDEIKKYEMRARVLNDVFAFMVAGHIGEYINVEEDDN